MLVKRYDMSTETKGKDVFTISIWVAVIGLLIVIYVSLWIIRFTVISSVEAPWNPFDFRPWAERDMTKVENNLALKILWIVQAAFMLILIFSGCCFAGRQKDRPLWSCMMCMFQGIFLILYICITMLLFANLDLETKRLISAMLDIVVYLVITVMLMIIIALAGIAGIVAAIAYGGGAISSACVRCGDAILEAISCCMICKEQDQQLAEEKTAILAKKNNNDAENDSPNDVATV
jgi:hypothetical protein